MITIPPLRTSASEGILAEFTSDVRLPGTKSTVWLILALAFLPPGEPCLNPHKPEFKMDYYTFSLKNKQKVGSRKYSELVLLSLLNIYIQHSTKCAICKDVWENKTPKRNISSPVVYHQQIFI